MEKLQSKINEKYTKLYKLKARIEDTCAGPTSDLVMQYRKLDAYILGLQDALNMIKNNCPLCNKPL